MRYRTTILYALAWLVYSVFTFTMFPHLNSNVLTPMIALLALGAWLYGRTAGLLFVLLGSIHHYSLTQCYADDDLYYANRIIGPLLCIAIVGLAGTLRNSLESIKEANARLDQAVRERTGELNDLARKLIERAETMRVSRGQELHDGIGQQLTGIQLYSTSLAELLAAEQNTGASLAYSLTNRARSVHNLIRRTARSLFPVQIGEIGLKPALQELAACLADIKNVDFKIETEGENHLHSVSQATALQLYRICQETALFILNHTKARSITIRISASSSRLHLAMEHDGESVTNQMKDSTEARLIEYRLMQVHGTFETRSGFKQPESLFFAAPNGMGETAA